MKELNFFYQEFLRFVKNVDFQNGDRFKTATYWNTTDFNLTHCKKICKQTYYLHHYPVLNKYLAPQMDSMPFVTNLSWLWLPNSSFKQLFEIWETLQFLSLSVIFKRISQYKAVFQKDDCKRFWMFVYFSINLALGSQVNI